MKESGEPIAMITAYDTPSARLVDAAGVDAILVGDSLGMTVLGYPSTLPVTMDDMLSATSAVVRGVKRPLVIADMPFLSFQVTHEEALRNAGRFLAEAGAQAVKLEGGRSVAPLVAHLVDSGVPVMGHVGLTPQSVNVFGGYSVRAKDEEGALGLLADCRALEAAGAFAIVLELVPAEVAEIISRELAIPTIGIGAGGGCDGQVQVFHDILGIGERTPRHARQYADIGAEIVRAVGAYAADVRAGSFPGEEQLTRAEPDVAASVEAATRRSPGA
jgi:3-methyl-2-oxobutanoate hydroxymethyltransferase